MPAAFMRISTSFLPGTGVALSCILSTSGAPGFVITIAFIAIIDLQI
jgi:hypothetical protein